MRLFSRRARDSQLATNNSATNNPATPSSPPPSDLDPRDQILDAIDTCYATIRFDVDGTIVDANANFLAAMGYTRDEIVGQHHRLFVEPKYAASPEYARFWEELRGGRLQTAEFQRFAKGGRPIWIQASYILLRGAGGDPVGVMKLATDITDRKNRDLELLSKTAAISQTQAMIEFLPDGTILEANENFLNAVGYTQEEIQGGHHRMFLDPEYAQSEEYKEFWPTLAGGESISGEVKRIDKRGNDVWLQATYTTIPDTSGNVCRVVKFAYDITEMVTARAEKQRVSTSLAQGLQELSASANEINTRVTESASLADSVSRRAESAQELIRNLTISSEQIGEVVGVIKSMADQTNLLALNATIESARAGDAGKGFAVVAHEVKELARKTGEATSGIADSVRQIQSNVAEVVTSVDGISSELSQVSENTSGVAASIEEQSAVIQNLGSDARQLRAE